MSGHSHSKKIKHEKDATDAQRSNVFSKLAKEISIAAKQGTDPAINSRLRVAMERARSFNMPKDNVERAVKRATGEGGQNVQLEEMLLEAYGPGGIAILIFVITDNKNRTLSEIKQILSTHQGKLGEGGAVRWMFEQKGVLTIPQSSPFEGSRVAGQKSKEELELLAIEAGAEDIFWNEDGSLDIYTKPTELENVKKKLEEQGIPLGSTSLDWVAKDVVEAAQNVKEASQKLFDALDENEDVQDVYSNLI
jgi:YebC/PmpR family DNA-binding regulatory protein